MRKSLIQSPKGRVRGVNIRSVLGLLLALGAPGLVATNAEAQPPQHQTLRLRGYGPVPEYHTVRPGDTLWDITGRYYGDPYDWPRVWSYNPEITNPHWIYPLDQVRLRVMGAAAAEGPHRYESGTVWVRDLGFLDPEAYEDAGVIIGSPEENMLLSAYDDIYVRFEEGARVQPGRSYTIFRRLSEDERDDLEDGGVVLRVFGTARLRSYDRERGIGRATIEETLDPIERGFILAAVPREFNIVEPSENRTELEGQVVAALIEETGLLGHEQVIFVNFGSEEGAAEGNRIFVVREGDDWRESHTIASDRDEFYGASVDNAPEAAEYPPEVAAEGIIIDVKDHSATVVITRSLVEIERGDRVEMRLGF